MHDTIRKQKEILEDQIASLSREKILAEKAAADLTAEIDQARSALADEWEDHMTDHERLLAVADKKHAPAAPVPFPGVKKEAEIIKKRSLIVKVPGFPPAEARSSWPATPEIPAEVPEEGPRDIRSVEDLFEDDEEDKNTVPEIPEVSIVREPSAETAREALGISESGSSDNGGSFFEDPASPFHDTADETGTDDEDSITETGDQANGQNIPFDRTQWLDLLRWSHHCEALTQDQRNHIIRLGRLIQKGRRLTNKQEEQVHEIIALVRGLGYRYS